jgi:CheY-like chemotaxis protein
MRVLAVDDRKEDLYLLKKMLEGKGYDVNSASNGKEALDKINTSPPDLVISDILMPKMDGYQLLKEVKTKEKYSKIPFVFYSATYTSKQDEEFAYSLGASRFIVKPQEPDDFIKIIDKTVKDTKKGILLPLEPKIEGDEVYLKEYNERLIQKLEDTVTKLEKAREEIKGSRDFLEAIVDSIKDGVIFIDNKGRVSLANQRGKELQKVALKKILPKLEPGEDYSGDLDIFFNERYYDPHCYAVTGPKKRYLGTTIVLRDVTARRKVQEELKARVDELQKWQTLTVGREIKMIELKKMVKELEKRIGKTGKNKT